MGSSAASREKIQPAVMMMQACLSRSLRSSRRACVMVCQRSTVMAVNVNTDSSLANTCKWHTNALIYNSNTCFNERCHCMRWIYTPWRSPQHCSPSPSASLWHSCSTGHVWAYPLLLWLPGRCPCTGQQRPSGTWGNEEQSAYSRCLTTDKKK